MNTSEGAAPETASLSRQNSNVSDKSGKGSGPTLSVLLVCNGMSCAELSESVADLKSSSKNLGTHKEREFWWEAYSKILGCVSGREGELYGFVTYTTPGAEEEADKNAVEFIPWTGKQKQMIAGPVEILGKKFKPKEDEGKPTKHWFACYFGPEAEATMHDLTRAEPVIYCTVDGVFVATKLKRRKCKGGSTVKTVREFEKYISELEPGNPVYYIYHMCHIRSRA